MKSLTLPALPLAAWEESRLYLQLVCQMVGKVRLALHPKLNHWWHVPLYVSAQGLTTGAIPAGEREFDIEVNLVEHLVELRSGDGRRVSVELRARPIADFYRELMEALTALDVRVAIRAVPFKCKSSEPFARDTVHSAYDGGAVRSAWDALQQIEPVFKEFRGRFIGKCSPVHFFWHSFDLAVTRFSGRRAPEMPDVDLVTKEAYSHEVISAGFWFGDDNVPEPAFYAYCAPSPPGLERTVLRPAAARWQESNGSPLALLRYDDVRQSDDPHAMLLDFLQSSYETAAKLADWPRGALEV